MLKIIVVSECFCTYYSIIYLPNLNKKGDLKC